MNSSWNFQMLPQTMSELPNAMLTLLSGFVIESKFQNFPLETQSELSYSINLWTHQHRISSPVSFPLTSLLEQKYMLKQLKLDEVFEAEDVFFVLDDPFLLVVWGSCILLSCLFVKGVHVEPWNWDWRLPWIQTENRWNRISDMYGPLKLSGEKTQIFWSIKLYS